MCRFDFAVGHAALATAGRTKLSKILYLRQRHHFGAGRIADYLKRFHQLKIARSSVHRILHTHSSAQSLRRVVQEFYQLLDKDSLADDIHLFNDKLREWEGY